MDLKYPVNQRIRRLMAYLGYEDNVHGFATNLLQWSRSDKLRNVYNDDNEAKTELLVEITNKIVNSDGDKPDGHWLLTGEGSMFVVRNKKAADEAAKRELDELFEDLKHLRKVNAQQTETILNLSRTVGIVNQA